VIIVTIRLVVILSVAAAARKLNSLALCWQGRVRLQVHLNVVKAIAPGRVTGKIQVHQQDRTPTDRWTSALKRKAPSLPMEKMWDMQRLMGQQQQQKQP
jgi:hypothetical protein